MESIFKDYVLPCLCAALASTGFSLVFNLRGKSLLVGGAGGALCYLIYLLGGSSIVSAFFAAAAVGVYAGIMARLTRCPVTGYVLIPLMPLVPGGGIYYAMRWCIAGDTQQFLSTLIDTFGMALALAVGSTLTSSLFRTVGAHILAARRRKK